MSTNARLTLIGLLKYDSNLFELLSLPSGYDRDTFIDSLLLEHGEKCVLYSNPNFMKQAIGAWSRKNQLELKRIYEALTAEYNPIYNYDRHEEITDGENRTLETSNSAGHTAKDTPDFTDTLTNNLKDKITNDFEVTTSQTVDGVTEHKISADNSGSYQEESKDIIDNGTTKESNDGTITTDKTGNATNRTAGTTQNLVESSNATSKDVEKRDNSHTAHIYGNIGVTTSSQMVTEVVKQRIEYNLYDTVTKLFANEFLLAIY